MDSLIHTIIPAVGEMNKSVFLLLSMLVPVFCVFKGYGFFKTNLISIPPIVAFILLLYYLADIHPRIQLQHMGFDFSEPTDSLRMRNVAPAFRDTAAALYASLFGSTSIKVMFAILFGVPYPSVVWAVLMPVRSVIKFAIKTTHY